MAQSKVVNLKELARELNVFTDAHIEKLKKATVAGVMSSIPKLVENSPVDTGLYASSWAFTKTEQGAIVGNTAPHAPIIEHGARPFTPPIKPLLEWAKRVLQDPSQPPNYSNEVWALARGVQKKIAEHGMKPRKVLENMIPQIIDSIREEYRRVR